MTTPKEEAARTSSERLLGADHEEDSGFCSLPGPVPDIPAVEARYHQTRAGTRDYLSNVWYHQAIQEGPEAGREAAPNTTAPAEEDQEGGTESSADEASADLRSDPELAAPLHSIRGYLTRRPDATPDVVLAVHDAMREAAKPGQLSGSETRKSPKPPVPETARQEDEKFSPALRAALDCPDILFPLLSEHANDDDLLRHKVISRCYVSPIPFTADYQGVFEKLCEHEPATHRRFLLDTYLGELHDHLEQHGHWEEKEDRVAFATALNDCLGSSRLRLRCLVSELDTTTGEEKKVEYPATLRVTQDGQFQLRYTTDRGKRSDTGGGKNLPRLRVVHGRASRTSSRN